MAISESGDPRLGMTPAEGEKEESVRPVVALPRSGPSGLALGIAAIVAAAILFGVLDARRRSLSQPSVRMRAADAAQIGASPPPPLYIPAPPPPPVQVVEHVVAPVAAPQPVPAPPPPQIVYVPQPAPQMVQPQPMPVRTTVSGPALVIDTTTAPTSAPGSGTSGPGDVPANVAAALGGTVTSGGRVRAGAFANRSATVPQGTLIPAVLETAFDSTRPGLARAIVSRDIRGFDGTRILIPRGSRLVGEYRTDAASGQKRAMINWSRLVRPDGATIAIGSPAADTLGRGGIRAHVNSHFFERFAGALLQTALEVGANLGTRAATGNVILALPGSTTSITSPLIPTGRVVPTLTVAAGTSISVFVAHDLDFSGGESRK